MSTVHVHWTRPLDTSTVHVHWTRPLDTCWKFHVGYFLCPLDTSTGHVHCARPLDTSTGHLWKFHVGYFLCPLDTSTGHVHCARPLDTSTGHVHFSCPVFLFSSYWQMWGVLTDSCSCSSSFISCISNIVHNVYL